MTRALLVELCAALVALALLGMRGLAGNVMGQGGLLVLRWRLGPVEMDTGFRADDKTTYPAWVQAINGKVHA
jgi:hypothetical protein